MVGKGGVEIGGAGFCLAVRISANRRVGSPPVTGSAERRPAGRAGAVQREQVSPFVAILLQVQQNLGGGSRAGMASRSGPGEMTREESTGEQLREVGDSTNRSLLPEI